jgi:hypothetical protein
MSTDRPDEAGNVAEQVHGWFAGRLPAGWFTGPAEVLVDREEITVIGTLPPAAAEAGGSGAATGAELDAMVLGRSRRFREETRDARIELAHEAESLFSRKVS